MIYRDFDHWWREGKHGWSSASREYAIEIWNDLEETINASRDDYKNAMVDATIEQLKFRVEAFDAALKYIEQYSKPDAPKFWRWFLDKSRKNATKRNRKSL